MEEKPEEKVPCKHIRNPNLFVYHHDIIVSVNGEEILRKVIYFCQECGEKREETIRKSDSAGKGK